eukprot:1339262-Amorphochlora_amoeboformis.AAC.1
MSFVFILRSGDVMILESDKSLKSTGDFTAQVSPIPTLSAIPTPDWTNLTNLNNQQVVLDVPHELKPGYSPIGFVRCG